MAFAFRRTAGRHALTALVQPDPFDATAEYVLDTGPLLCLGAGKPFMTAFLQRCYGRTHWVGAVRDELARQARGSGPLQRAASRYSGRGASWLPSPVDLSGPESAAEVAGVLAEVQRCSSVAPQNRKRGMNPDLGEAQSIVHAERTANVLMSHDNAALRVARARRVRAVTLVDLARRLVAEGSHKPAPLVAEFQKLRQTGLDIGGVVNGVLDLAPTGARPHRLHPQ